ncbi:BPSS1780 family membrane protein [Allopusillimonas soli]|uniref:BPSS1780 family membrane protein n=1 Tax=Allopusillimonas soli TaxID=659016 RepID=UPI001FD6713D|nr:BPSS1780 family membrane protein [Allopusillimonas soli]
MQAAKLPITAGWSWIHNGLGLFRRQPLALFFWSLVTGFLITASYLIPLLGQMALIVCTPLLTFVILCACRNVEAGRAMQLPMWLQPLSNRETRKRLLALGLAYLAACLAAGLIATLPFIGQLGQALDAQGNLDETALLAAMKGPFITFGLLYVVISGFFWHAPALIGWHHIRMPQALFFSMVACWRNKWPFLAYGASWIAIFFAVDFTGSFLVTLGLSPGAVQVVLTPINIIVAAILYCSFYPAYVSVFGNTYDMREDNNGSIEVGDGTSHDLDNASRDDPSDGDKPSP